VAAALADAEDLPESVRSLLSAKLPQSLGVALEDRHPYQARLAEMVGEALSGIEARLQERLESASKEVGDADGARAGLEAAAAEAQAAVEAKEVALKDQKDALTGVVKDLKSAKSALAEAEVARKTGDADIEMVVAKQEQLGAFHKDVCVPLASGVGQEAMTDEILKRVAKVGEDFDMDASLLSSLPGAIVADPEARGEFDRLVITQLDDHVTQQLNALADQVGAAEPAKAERQRKVEEARTALEGLEEQQRASSVAVVAADAAWKEAASYLSAAQKALRDFGPEMQNTAKRCDALKEKLEDFRDDILGTYQQLKARSIAPPPADDAGDAAAAADEAGQEDAAPTDAAAAAES